MYHWTHNIAAIIAITRALKFHSQHLNVIEQIYWITFFFLLSLSLSLSLIRSHFSLQYFRLIYLFSLFDPFDRCTSYFYFHFVYFFFFFCSTIFFLSLLFIDLLGRFTCFHNIHNFTRTAAQSLTGKNLNCQIVEIVRLVWKSFL